MTCHITGSVVIPDGSSAANRKITFRKEEFTVTTDGGLTVVPEYITVYTDALGAVSFDLLPGTYSGFYVTPPDGRLPFRFNVPSDTPTANFASLIVTSSVTEDQGLIDLMNQAYDAIQNAGSGGGGSTTPTTEAPYLIPLSAMSNPSTAITTALASYADVVVPAGVWSLTSTVEVPSNKTLRGIPGAKLKHPHTLLTAIRLNAVTGAKLIDLAFDDTAFGSAYHVEVTDSTYCEIDLTFNKGNSGVKLTRSDYCKVHVVAREMQANGIALLGSQYNEVRLYEGRNLGNFGIYVTNDGSRISTRNRLYAEKYADPATLLPYQTSVVGVPGGPAQYYLASENQIGLEAIGITTTNDFNIIEGSICRDTRDNGISITSDYNTLSNLLIENCAQDGLHFFGSNNSAAGVTSINNGDSGVCVGKGAYAGLSLRNTMSGVTAYGNARYGVEFWDVADDNVIDGAFAGNTLGESLNLSSGTNIVNGGNTTSPVLDLASWSYWTGPGPVGGAFTVTKTLNAVGFNSGSEISSITFSGPLNPFVLIRNNSGFGITLRHSNSFLRLAGGTDRVLPNNHATLFVFVSGTVWQEIGSAATTGSSSAYDIMFGGTTSQTITDLSATSITATSSNIVLDVTGGGTLTTIVGPGANHPVVFLRNRNVTPVTLTHGTSGLRLNGGATRTLGQYQGIILVNISGNVWQEYGDGVSSGGGASTWGSITGTLSSQTDLQTELDSKVGLSNTQTITGKKHFSEPVTFVGRTSDPSSHVEGEVWYNTTDNHLKANVGGSILEIDSPLWSNVTSKPTTLSGYGITDAAPLSHTHTFASLTSVPDSVVRLSSGVTDGTESNPSGATTVALVDHARTYIPTTSLTLTLPTAPFAGFRVTVIAGVSLTVTLAPGGSDVVDRDNFVHPGEVVTLVYNGSGSWRRRVSRGFGLGQNGPQGLLSDMRGTTFPGGRYRVTTGLTANIADRPSCLTGATNNVDIERLTTTQFAQRIWDPAAPEQGMWLRYYDGSSFGLWLPAGIEARLSTSSLPTSGIAVGSEAYDTTLGKSVRWSGSAWVAASSSSAWGDITGTPTTLEGYGITDAGSIPWVTPPSGEYVQTNIGSNNGVSNLSLAANQLCIYPFTPRADVVMTDATINVAAIGGAGAVCKMVFYGSDPDTQRPGSLLLETADVSVTSLGFKTAAAPITLYRGRTYWVGVRASLAVTVSGWGMTGTPEINGGATPTTSNRKYVSRTVTYATGAPTSWVWSSAEIAVSNNAPAIWLKV